MGNYCLRKDTTIVKTNSSATQHQSKEEGSKPNIDGKYREKLDQNRNNLVKTREVRAKNQQKRVEELKKELQGIENSGDSTNQAEFRKKKIQIEI